MKEIEIEHLKETVFYLKEALEVLDFEQCPGKGIERRHGDLLPAIMTLQAVIKHFEEKIK